MAGTRVGTWKITSPGCGNTCSLRPGMNIDNKMLFNRKTSSLFNFRLTQPILIKLKNSLIPHDKELMSTKPMDGQMRSYDEWNNGCDFEIPIKACRYDK